MIACGCDDFVRKPFQANEIFAKMAQYLGVQYLYEDAPLAELAENSSNQPIKLTVDSFRVMSSEWVAKVHQRAAEGNDILLLELMQAIPEEQTALKIALTNLVENFQFEEIINLTQSS